MKILLLYYSYGGNTHRAARHIQKILGCDVQEILTVTPYSGDYNSVVSQGKREVEEGYEPPVRPFDKDLDHYDTVILGTPVWWYTVAPAGKSVLKAADWNGKSVYPFATNGGWVGHTFRDMKTACAGADVKQGLNIRFDGDQMQTSIAEIDRWTAEIKEE